MNREDLERAVLDTLDALDELDRSRQEFMKTYRETRADYLECLKRYRRQLRGEERQMELGE